MIERWRRAVGRFWWSSLPLRVILLTLAGSVLVLVLGGMLLISQTTQGILDGKRSSAVLEASTALDRMQTQLQGIDTRTASVYERLGQIADLTGSEPNQFKVVVQGPVSRFVSPGITEASVPASLETAVASGAGMFATPTLVDYADPGRPDEPGLAIGATLQAPSGVQSYPIYFIFPETQEMATITMLRRVALSIGALLLVALAGIAWLVSRQVVGPVREASIAASRIASGEFSERLPVRGSDDLASLATSMNDMAAELSSQIGRLEDLSRVQQRFVSDVSHELRTPLTTVRMAADLIYDERDEMPPFASRSAELMRLELDRFESLLADLLEISRFDAGAAVVSLEETDLVHVVCEELDAQQAFAASKGCELILRSTGPARAQMDARRITRIVRNLVTNAIEHGESRPIEVTVASNDRAVAVSVRDHGIGFRPDQAEQVFLRFWRADPSRNRTVGGTGLGLAISREDTLLHHGLLQAWGRPGQGAQFVLVLPVDQEQAQVVGADSPIRLGVAP